MEICVDAAEGFAAPKETFVSMRIGDFQKQSRFGAAKTYKFPKLEDPNGLARIEVFQRVGHLTVSLGKLHQSAQDVEVPVDMPGMSHLPMRLGLHGGSPVEPEPKAKSSKVKTKLDAAQKYLAEHQLEEVIADAMREVIHEKPTEPLAFLSTQILKHASKKQPELLPPINAPKPTPPAPVGNRKANPSEKLPPIGGSGKPEEAAELNRLRLEARDALLQSAQNGSLAAVLSADVAGQQDLESLRKEAASALINAARDGSLDVALRDTRAGQGAEDVGSLRKEAANALINAARDGSLDVALRQTRAGQDNAELEELRQQARATLLQGAKDGSLKAALQSNKEEDKVEDLRVQARDALLRASINGTLEKALKEGKPDKKAQGSDMLEELRVQARDALVKSSLDGTLEEALNAGKTQKAPPYKYTPSVGSWLQKKPFQVERPWYYTVHGETEDDKVIKDLQCVIAEKEREIEALKASLKSGGLDLKAAPAAAPAPAKDVPTSLTPFRPYYAAHLRTVKPEAMQKLYAKFPAQPKPVPAPKAAPEAAPAPAKAEPAPEAPPVKFSKMPSVGTWLAFNPNKNAQTKPASVAPQQSDAGNPPKTEASPAANAPAKEPRKFRQLPSVGTWLAFKPFEESPKPLRMLERSHSKLLCMNKEELITGYEKEIRQLNEEIAKLKSSKA